MAKIQGAEKLVARLRDMAAKARRDSKVSVSVGYTASYATRVHEDLQAFHSNGQAKFLEQPARQLTDDGTLGGIVAKAMLRGATLAQGLVLAGLRLQRESQLLVPVDTGALKASAFTRLDP